MALFYEVRKISGDMIYISSDDVNAVRVNGKH